MNAQCKCSEQPYPSRGIGQRAEFTRVAAFLPRREGILNRIAARVTEDRHDVTPQRLPDEDRRTIEEIMNEADPPGSQTQFLLNNLLLIVGSTTFLAAIFWGLYRQGR
jgi:hypothetical protein